MIQMTITKPETTTKRSLAAELIERYISRDKENRKLLKEWFGMSTRQLDDVIAGRVPIERFIPYEDLYALAGQLGYTGSAWDLLEPRKTRRARRHTLTRKAYEEQQRQHKSKLCARVELTTKEQREVAERHAAGKLNKTTADALTVYAEPGYEVRRSVMNKSEYFVNWTRECGCTDRSYLGVFSSDEDAIVAFDTWKRSHRAYVPETAIAYTVPETEETASPTDIEGETIAAATDEETEAYHEDTSDIATSGHTAICEGLSHVRQALCAGHRSWSALGGGLDLRDAVDRRYMLALAY